MGVPFVSLSLALDLDLQNLWAFILVSLSETTQIRGAFLLGSLLTPHKNTGVPTKRVD